MIAEGVWGTGIGIKIFLIKKITVINIIKKKKRIPENLTSFYYTFYETRNLWFNYTK